MKILEKDTGNTLYKDLFVVEDIGGGNEIVLGYSIARSVYDERVAGYIEEAKQVVKKYKSGNNICN